MCITIVLALVGAFAANSASITVSGAVTGAGALTLAAPSTSSWSNTLDATDNSTNYMYALTVIDARGTGAGWNITVGSTTFSDGAGHSLAAGSITGITNACAGTTCTNPTNSITYPITLGATANKVFNSAASSGLGKFTVTPTTSVTVPGNSYAGTYTATVTVALVTGP